MTPAEVIDAVYLEWLRSDDVTPLSVDVLKALAYNGYEIVSNDPWKSDDHDG